MKKIKLTNGEYTFVDGNDYDELCKYSWHLSRGYVEAYEDGKSLLMHRIIMKPRKGQIIDHVNRNPHDNTRSNLRVCDRSLNGMNRGKQKNNKSGYKGVVFDKRRGCWAAFICKNKKRMYLGSYTDKKNAAMAYNEAAAKHHGEFACVNIV